MVLDDITIQHRALSVESEAGHLSDETDLRHLFRVRVLSVGDEITTTNTKVVDLLLTQ